MHVKVHDLISMHKIYLMAQSYAIKGGTIPKSGPGEGANRNIVIPNKEENFIFFSI